MNAKKVHAINQIARKKAVWFDVEPTLARGDFPADQERPEKDVQARA